MGVQALKVTPEWVSPTELSWMEIAIEVEGSRMKEFGLHIFLNFPCIFRPFSAHESVYVSASLVREHMASAYKLPFSSDCMYEGVAPRTLELR